MDFNNNNNNGQNGYPAPAYDQTKGAPLASASMFLGIAAILTAVMATAIFPFILGGLSIVLAILSKGASKKMIMQAKVAIICSIAGLLLNFMIIASSFNYILEHPELMQNAAITYDRMYEQMYGTTSEEIFGESIEDMVNDIFNQGK